MTAALPDIEGLRGKIEVAPGFCCRGPWGGVPCLEFPRIGFSSISNLDLQCLAQCIPLRQQGQILRRFLLAFLGQSGEGNGKPLQYSCLENPMNSMKRQNDRILKEELPRSVGLQYATGDQWRNNSKKNEGMEPNQKQYPVVDMTCDRSKV